MRIKNLGILAFTVYFSITSCKLKSLVAVKKNKTPQKKDSSFYLNEFDKTIEDILSKMTNYKNNFNGLYKPLDLYIDNVISANINDLRFVFLYSDFDQQLAYMSHEYDLKNIMNKNYEVNLPDEPGEDSNHDKTAKSSDSEKTDSESDESRNPVQTNQMLSPEGQQSAGLALILTMSGLRLLSTVLNSKASQAEFKSFQTSIDAQIAALNKLKEIPEFSDSEKINKLLDELQIAHKSRSRLAFRYPQIPDDILKSTTINNLPEGMKKTLNSMNSINKAHKTRFFSSTLGASISSLSIPFLIYFATKSQTTGLNEKDLEVEAWTLLVTATLTLSTAPEFFKQGKSFYDVHQKFWQAKNSLLSNGLNDVEVNNLRKQVIEFINDKNILAAYKESNKNNPKALDHLEKFLNKNEGNITSDNGKYKIRTDVDLDFSESDRIASIFSDRYTQFTLKPPAIYDKVGRFFQNRIQNNFRDFDIGTGRRIVFSGSIVGSIGILLGYVAINAIVTGSKRIDQKRRGLSLLGDTSQTPIERLYESLSKEAFKLKSLKFNYFQALELEAKKQANN